MRPPEHRGRLRGSAEDGATGPVTAVIVAFDGGDKLLRCLEALERQSLPLEAIIVTDNASTDDSPARVRLRFPRVRIVELRANVGLPAARNIGLRRATTDLVLLVDADVYLAEDCLERLVLARRRRDPTVVCPRILLFPETDVVQCDGAAAHFVGTMALRHAYRPAHSTPAVAAAVDGCIGACMLVDRRRVLDAGGFDEDYFLYFEDHEFCLRLRALGHRFLCEPAAVVYHDRGAGTPGLSWRGHGRYPSRRAYLTLRGRVTLLLTHYRLRTLVLLAPALAAYELASLSLALGSGWGRAWLGAWAWPLGSPRTIFERRRRIQRRKVVGDRDLLTGGALPLAPDLLRSKPARRAVAGLSALLDGYWRLARRAIG